MRASHPALRRLLADGFDTLAEAAVAPGFSRLGIAGRRRLERWEPPPGMDGRVVVVTGATSGIGLAAARALAELGAGLHIVGRDRDRGEQACRQLQARGVGVVLHLVDMADTAAVVALGAQLTDAAAPIHGLIHGAGALNRDRRSTPAGVEATVATGILGPYVLSAALAPALARAPGAAIVTISSGGMYSQSFDLEGLEMGADNYDGVVAYARTKRAQVVLADAWARALAPTRVASYAMHPGWVDTPGLSAGLPGFAAWCKPLLRTPAEGADTAVWLAAGGAAPATSGFYHDRRVRSQTRFRTGGAPNGGDGNALLRWCEARTGVARPPGWAQP